MGNMPPISDPTDGLPGDVQDHEATLIETTHGHTVLSPNAVWVRRPRKLNTPLRSPDGIERFAEEENLGTPSKMPGNKEESTGEGTRTPVAKTLAKTRRGVPVDSAGARVSGAEKMKGTREKKGNKEKSDEPGRQAARRSARNSIGHSVDSTAVDSDAAAGPSPAGAGVAEADMQAGRAAPAAPAGGPSSPDGPGGPKQALEEGQIKRRRKKSAKLQSDEFVVGDEEASPILSQEEQGTDDDEFVPGGLRAAGKASKSARGPVRGDRGVFDVSARRHRELGRAQVANASLNQTRTPPECVMPDQRRAEGATSIEQTVRTPSMNLFRHFQEIQQPSNSDLAGDIQKVLEENIQAEADLKDISDLMAEIAKVSENTHVWEEMLESKSKILDKLRMQNGTLKELFAGLGLSKNNLPDFSMNDVESDEGRKKRMLSFGRRLVSLLRHGKRPKDAVDGKPGGAAGAPADMTGSVDGVSVVDTRDVDVNEDAKDANVKEDADVSEPAAEGRDAADDEQKGGETPSANPNSAGNDTDELEERFHPIAAQVAGAGLQAAKGDPARAVMYLINKGFQARQADGFDGDPPPEFCSGGVAGDKAEKEDQEDKGTCEERDPRRPRGMTIRHDQWR